MRTILKTLIFITIGLSLLAILIPEVQFWLALSWKGITNLYLWQLITYIFIEPGPVSLGFFLQLGFNMYILWMFGSFLIERSHTRHFLTLYFGAALVASLAALAFPKFLLAGSTNPVYAILFAWMMLNQGTQLLLFFTIPLKAQWLILSLIGLTLFLDLAANDWVAFASLSASVLYAYFFTLIVWREQSPFPFLHPLERTLFRLLEKKKENQPYQRTKIYDIKSGAPVLDDDQFMDAMLDQISRLGENSLTAAEKKRMKAISEKKNKQNN